MKKIPRNLGGIPIPRKNEFSKVKGHKVNIQNSTVFPYVYIEYVDNKIKNAIQFTIA